MNKTTWCDVALCLQIKTEVMRQGADYTSQYTEVFRGVFIYYIYIYKLSISECRNSLVYFMRQPLRANVTDFMTIRQLKVPNISRAILNQIVYTVPLMGYFSR